MDKLASPPAARGQDGRFVKGYSGNNRGRPRIDPRLQALARANSEPAILALVELSTDPKVSEKIQFLATANLLKAAFNVNFLGHHLKRYGMTAGQYIHTPRYVLTGEKPSKNNSETVNKIVAIRKELNRLYAAKQDQQRKKTSMKNPLTPY